MFERRKGGVKGWWWGRGCIFAHKTSNKIWLTCQKLNRQLQIIMVVNVGRAIILLYLYPNSPCHGASVVGVGVGGARVFSSINSTEVKKKDGLSYDLFNSNKKF